MVVRRRIGKPASKPVEEEEVEEVLDTQVEPEDIDVDVEEDDAEADDADEEEEPEPPAKPTKKAVVPTVSTKKVVVPPVAAKPAAKPAAKVEPPAAPAKKVVVPPPAAKVAVKPAAKPVAKIVEPDPVVEEDVVEEAPAKVAAPSLKLKTVSSQVMEELLPAMMEAMSTGQVIVITKTADGKWTVGPASGRAAASAAGKLTGKAYLEEVCTQEYLKFDEEWNQLTAAEKRNRAKKEGVKWEDDKDERVNMIRLTQAMREHMGVEKYKPEYQTRKQRDAVRG